MVLSETFLLFISAFPNNWAADRYRSVIPLELGHTEGINYLRSFRFIYFEI